MTYSGDQPFFRVIAENSEELQFFYERVLPDLAQQNIRSAVIIQEGDRPAPLSSGVPQAADDESVLFILLGSRRNLTVLFDLFRHADMIFIVDGLSAMDIEYQASPFVVADFSGKSGRAVQYLLDIAHSRLDEREIWACILIGGKSSRMGQPKHLLAHGDGQSWLERNVRLVKEKVTGVAISGGGELPSGLQHYPRLQDIPGVQGPLTGLISAMRWRPEVSWLVCACDLPAVTAEAIDWLLADRRPGCWAKIPRLSGAQRGEPLLARYEPQCGPLFEAMGRSGSFSLHRIFSNDKIDMVEVPADLEGSWRNVNTPAELLEFKGT